MQTQINPNKFFSIVYTTKDQRQETYIVRAGVTKWKTPEGTTAEVLGTGHAAKEGSVKLYAANRKGYRTFILQNISKVKQGNVITQTLNF